jgi:hypothetical protein
LKKIGAFISCLVLVALAGCFNTTVINPPSVNQSNDTQNVRTQVKGFPGLAEGYGLYGATVTIDGVYPGWSGGVPVTIVNGRDKDREFHISLQQPGDSIREGYEPFPEKYYDWFVIADKSPTIVTGVVREVPVALYVPEDMPEEMKGKSYEVRILVEDWSQTGFVQLALQEKWLITFEK